MSRDGPDASLVKCFIDNESGSTALEYGLVAAGITVVAVTALNAVFALYAGLFATVVADLTAAGQLNRGAERREAEAAR